LEPVEAWVVGETRPSLLLLAAVAGLLLVITCATVASLLFVRVTERQRELAVRTALGADRSQIARLLLAEGAWLCFAGTASGVLLAVLIQPLLRAFVPPVVPRADQIGANVWTVVFAMGVALMTVLLVAVLPAWRSGRCDVVSALKRASNTVSADASTTVWRRTLLAMQAAVATALLVAAVLLLVSFWRLNRTPLGFDGDRVLTVEMRLQDRRFFKPEAIAAFQEALTARVSAVPGILEVGLTSAVPFRGVDFTMAFDRPGVPNSRYNGNGRFVDATFFSVMRIPLLAGRLFNRTDTATSPKVMIASEAFARSAFGAENPIGREIDASDPTTIVGVVGDLRYVSRDQAATPAVYYPRIQRPSELICLVARTGPGAVDVGASIRRVIHEIDPGVPVMNLTTIDRIVSESVANPRFLTVTTVAFSALALVLTLIGLAVLVVRAVAERRREMAIRAALGAPAHTLVRLLLLQGLVPVTVGTVVGLVAAFLGASLLGQFLFDVAPHQPVIYAGVAVFVAAVAVPTCLVPARRVAAAAPAAVLRAE
jgi:putative ABC transport system permease protein